MRDRNVIRTLASEIHKEREDFTIVLSRIERQLVSVGARAEISVDIETQGLAYVLTWREHREARAGNTARGEETPWCLMVRPDMIGGEYEPLARWPLAVQMAAARKLGVLVESIVPTMSVLKRDLSGARDALTVVHDYLVDSTKETPRVGK